MKGSVALILLLVVVIVGMMALHWAILPDPSRRNYEFFPDMVESVARDAQSPAMTLDDGTVVDLRPPQGSISRGFVPFPYPATPEGALLAGQELVNPIDIEDRDAVTRGAFVFNTFCSICHGAGGRGDGTVTVRGVPPPPSLLLEHAVEMTDGQMFHLITVGQGNMASYASQVEREDRWRAIRYIRTLQSPPDVSTVTSLPEEP